MTYKKRLFFYFLIVFIVFIAVDITMQMNREKKYKTEILRSDLQVYAEIIERSIENGMKNDSILALFPSSIRLTIIDPEGNVTYDNVLRNIPYASNHAERPEIASARAGGTGSAIRKSESTESEYLYFVRRTEKGDFVRVALPYHITFRDFLQKENIFMYAIILLFTATLFVILLLTDKYSRVMSSLKKFVTAAENGDINYASIRFPNTDSGEIGNKVISLYKQLEESKQQIDLERGRNRQLKQEMTNNIAHELKTPVSSILGYTETLLSDKPVTSEEQHYFIERTYAQALRLSELIKDVALITKTEEASHYFIKDNINVRLVSDEAIQELQAYIEKNNAQIHNRIPEHVEIIGNHNLIYSVFRNLIENALMHAGPDIHIVMECEKEDEDNYCFRFYDTGKGVRKEYLNKIFDRFLRIDEGRTRQDGGTGLGLSIVKNAILFHGGEIVARNRKEGGLEFVFNMSKEEIRKE